MTIHVKKISGGKVVKDSIEGAMHFEIKDNGAVILKTGLSGEVVAAYGPDKWISVVVGDALTVQ